jgi:aspartyl-tRNA(Asn)/glutamyl-tRNA(Gln) amidotransferase subunit B
MVSEGELGSRGAKDILKIMSTQDGDPKVIAEENNLIQSSDSAHLDEVAKKIISENPKAVEEYKKGKEASLQFLVGQGMKETKGSANPEILKASLLRALSKVS